MHVIPAYQTSITLFRRNGDVWSYPTMSAARKALGLAWITRHVGAHFRMHVGRAFSVMASQGVYVPLYEEFEFVMRDDAGAVVTAPDFRVAKPYRPRGRWRLLDRWNGEGPVPGIGHGGGGCGYYFRHPHTTPARREACLVMWDDDEVAPRAKRNAANLPNSWDDSRRADFGVRCWKNHRKTQWR